MMFKFFALFAAGLLATAVVVAPAAHAQGTQRDEQGKARKDLRAGNVLSLRDIEKKVVPQMRGMEYLGPAYDSVAMAYRLKFIKDGKVMFVDVDARSGRILSRSQ